MSISRRHSTYQREKKLERFFGNKVTTVSFKKNSKPCKFFGEDLQNAGFTVGHSLSPMALEPLSPLFLNPVDQILACELRTSISSNPSTLCLTPVISPATRLSLDSCLSLPEIKATMAAISRSKLEKFFGEALVLNGKGSSVKVERLLGVDPLTIRDSASSSQV